MKKVVISVIVGVAVLMSGCTKPEQSKRLLEANGLTDVKITGYNFFGCSEHDSFHTGFNSPVYSLSARS